MESLSLNQQNINLLYLDNGEDIEICGINSILENFELKIPAYINCKKVSSLLSIALCGCQKLTKLILPGTIKKIKERSMQGCNKLEEIVLSDGIEEIGAHSFWGNNNLRRIKFPKSLKKIGNRAFPFCQKLEYLNFNDGLKEIGSNNFKFLNLNYIYFPNSLEKIGSNVLYGSKIEKTIYQGTEEEFNKNIKSKLKNVDFGVVYFILK